ncbi:hypothetical protein G6M89_05685 [Natronolimnobius sp. AArcel1]|uniref:DUF5789 family protein n=1 Tax=Natronolimnobius sp. AArcel1 TaxID=1679093 RepID=UPI0013EDC77B|nr:hypothetical protein [Natronolimnobius sp. AArcel1]NGM68506.1 hypothetical protein [Natronolimnobius sp. AArcel1]
MNHTDNADARHSLAVGEITQLFEDATFPMTTADVLERYADVEIVYPHESDPLQTVLETSGHETYESRDDLELAIFNGVRRDAVGRPRYSDRGDSPHDTDTTRMQQSF